MKDRYQDLVLGNCPRLISLINQNPLSPNYGCFDRDFWHYKIEKDFPSIVYQTGVLTLALLYANNFSGNVYHQNPKILELIRAGLFFWVKSQHQDGSFSEWYPFERSQVATAFTAYAVSESLLLLKKELSRQDIKKTVEALEKAGRWLRKHPDQQVANHTAGAVMALHNLYLLNRKIEFKKATEENLELLLSLQNQEGWFPEYGGADLGYLTLTVDYLAKYWVKTEEEKVLKVLKRAVDFAAFFLHPDGSFGGEYGSRGTKFLMPHGMKILSAKISLAKQILNHWQPLDIFDERYLTFFFLANWLQTALEPDRKSSRITADKSNLAFAQKKEFSQGFPEAGLLVKKTKKFYLICSFKKNGVVKVFKNQKLVFSDTGWWGRLKSGKIITSQWFNPKQTGWPIETQFGQFLETGLNEKIIPFRFFNYTLGRSSWAMKFFDRWLKKTFIQKVKLFPFYLKRNLTLEKDRILIEDELLASSGKEIECLVKTSCLSQKYTPTSNFFSSDNLLDHEERNFAKILNEKRKIKIKHEIR